MQCDIYPVVVLICISLTTDAEHIFMLNGHLYIIFDKNNPSSLLILGGAWGLFLVLRSAPGNAQDIIVFPRVKPGSAACKASTLSLNPVANF